MAAARRRCASGGRGRSSEVARQPLSGRRGRRVKAALVTRAARSARRRDRARQRFGRADPDHHDGDRAARRLRARAGAVVRHVPDLRDARGPALRRRAAARRPHARRRRDARGDRARAARARVARVSQQPDRARCFRARDDRAHRRGRARARRRRRGLLRASPTRRSCRACSSSRTSSSCARCRRSGMAGVRLGYAVAHPAWIAELDKVRPPYNVNALTQAVVPVLLAARRRARRAGGGDPARARAPRGGARGAARASTVFPTRRQFPAGARARRRALVRDACARRGILVKNVHGWHPLLARTACASPSARPPRTTPLRRSRYARPP